jgi:starch-binding outer membrane protein, SusD/RagB family
MRTSIKNQTPVLIILMLFTAACSEDFLDQKPAGWFIENDYYQNVQELGSGLTACYSFMMVYFEPAHWGIGDIGSDDAEKGSIAGDQPAFTDISFSRQTSDNSWVKEYWTRLYFIIARCNTVIDKSVNVVGDNDAVEILVDQARFLRALSYYHLVTIFGDVPLADRFLQPDELNIERSPAGNIWSFIESDLMEACDLPSKSEWSQSGRVTRGAVWSLLGKVYLTQKKYTLANNAFSKVLGSNEYQLMPDFGMIFRHEGENCPESIFEIQHKNTIEPGGIWSGPARIPREPPAGGWGFDCPTADLLNEFEKGDPRIIYTFLFKGDKFPGQEGYSIYTATNSFSPTGFHARKAWIPWSERVNLPTGAWDINYRYMRYSEILLLYAESLNEVNKPDSALLLLNSVRARARNTSAKDPQRISCAYDLSFSGDLLPDITTTEQTELRQAIWHEQRVELATEGHRRFTLLRTGRFKERMEASKGNKGCIVESHELLFPIPNSEVEISDGLLTQNPGY